jgi:signal transduction histidine kinase
MSQPTDSIQRMTEPSLLYSLGKSFGTALDLSELLVQTVETAVNLTGASEGWLILEDLDTGQLFMRATRTQSDATARAVEIPIDDLLTNTVMARQESLRLSSGDSPPELERIIKVEYPLLCVPLISKEQPIGVLRVHKKPGEQGFHHSEEVQLAGLAGYAAIAIENALLYKQAVDTTLELRLLVDAANALSWSLDLEQVLDAIARHMMRSLHAHWCIISAWDSQSGRVHRLAENRLALWPPERAAQLDLDSAATHQRALATLKPLATYITDQQLAPHERASLKAHGYRRMLLLPIQREGKIVGLAELANVATSRPFTAEEIGNSLREALKLAHVLNREHRDQWQTQLTESIRALIEAAGSDWCTIYNHDEKGGAFRRLVTFGAAAWLEEDGPELKAKKIPTLRIILGEQRVAVLHNPGSEPETSERVLFEDAGDSTLLMLPLVSQTETVGLVQLYDLDPTRRFTPRELALARALANQAAVALENAHLVRDLQHSLEKLRAMQSQLVRAARLSALGELSAVIAHQINNPLTTIIGDAWLLAQDISQDDPSYESAQAILRAGERAKRVVERVLNMAHHQDEAELLDVNHTIQETLQLVGVQVRESGVQVKTDLAPDLPPVRAISGQLEDVWMNLLVNASDAVKSKQGRQGQILIRSRLVANGTAIEVCVQDTGIGIPPEHLDRVFDPLFTTKPRGKGTGLGLYICHQIVADHNGSINISSVPGQGTTVTVCLPVEPPRVEEEQWPTS